MTCHDEMVEPIHDQPQHGSRLEIPAPRPYNPLHLQLVILFVLRVIARQGEGPVIGEGWPALLRSDALAHVAAMHVRIAEVILVEPQVGRVLEPLDRRLRLVVGQLGPHLVRGRHRRVRQDRAAAQGLPARGALGDAAREQHAHDARVVVGVGEEDDRVL